MLNSLTATQAKQSLECFGAHQAVQKAGISLEFRLFSRVEVSPNSVPCRIYHIVGIFSVVKMTSDSCGILGRFQFE